MRRSITLLGLTIWLLALTSTVPAAEQVGEVWRSPSGWPYAVSVNQTDGSVWVTTASSVVHRAGDGTVLSETEGFTRSVGAWWPGSVSVNSTDGSCRALDEGAAVCLAADGAELWRGTFNRPAAISVNPTDGSCWVSDYGANQVVHLSAEGVELWRGGGFLWPQGLSVNPTDGSCWVADFNDYEVVHLSSDGAELWRGSLGGSLSPLAVAVNPTDGSCWVGTVVNYPTAPVPGALASSVSGGVVHLAADGTTLWSGSDVSSASSLSVNPADGSCWVAGGGQVLHLSAQGAALWRGADSAPVPASVSVYATDGSCWVVDTEDERLVHLSASGAELWRVEGYATTRSLSANPTDGSCWIGLARQVAHVAANGTPLPGGEALNPGSVSVNQTDGSCWVVGHSLATHVAADGTELWRAAGTLGYESDSVNSADGSCWILGYANWLVHLAADGTELWSGRAGPPWWATRVSVSPADGTLWVSAPGDWVYPQFTPGGVAHLSEAGVVLSQAADLINPASISVNPMDGSCWVAERGDPFTLGPGAVVHLAADGTELGRTEGFARPASVSVNSTDGSCWVADAPGWDGTQSVGGDIVHLSATGVELWRSSPGAYAPSPYDFFSLAISVDSTDGSCWVIDRGHVAHLALVGPFTDVPPDFWAVDAIAACKDAHIVTGYPDGTFRPKEIITRDLMAAYLARARFGGDDLVPTGPATATFSDVPPSYGFYRHIEYCHDQGMVMGYQDGTYHPEWGVNRGQMAAFLARAQCGGDDFVPTGPATASFSDVPLDFGFYRYIEYIYAAGITTGYSDGTYHPEWVCNRDQMAVFVARAFHLLP